MWKLGLNERQKRTKTVDVSWIYSESKSDCVTPALKSYKSQSKDLESSMKVASNGDSSRWYNLNPIERSSVKG